jgi:cytoskeletal protein RodZ
MNQQPDKIFRDKLENYQQPAPPRAWDKIEAELEKKTHKGLWWKIAASLLLTAVVSYTLWIGMTKPDATQTATTTKPETGKPVQKGPSPTTATAESTTPMVSPPAKKDPASAGVTLESKRNRTIPGAHKTELPRQAEKKVAPESTDVAPDELTYTHDVVNTVAVETSTPQPSAPVVAESSMPANAGPKKIVITITAAESEKYLDKVALAEATSDEKKPSTFQKLLKKADDLKNNQDPFGELRQRKNEILALNFKNEKRGQNK